MDSEHPSQRGGVINVRILGEGVTLTGRAVTVLRGTVERWWMSRRIDTNDPLFALLSMLR